jgi:nucleotide-binding universal stress UspA family protein
MFVVGYDDSDGARRALDVAVELARQLGESLVVAFAAQPPAAASETSTARTSTPRGPSWSAPTARAL